MLKNYFKFTFFALALIFLFSCDKEPKTASSGVAQETTVFIKTCDKGSLKITKETTTAVGLPSVLDVDDLPVGAEVTVSGTVANGGVCGFTGPVSFSCKATVRIDLNKAFSCAAENSLSGASNSLGATVYSDPVIPTPNPISPNYPYNTTYQRSLISGDFIIYYGGTRTFTSLTVSSSSALVPALCKLNFICD